MNALWLTSWYPNSSDRYKGDFIQRHAFAASLYNRIQLIHIEIAERNSLTTSTEITETTNANLHEKVILIRASGLPYPFNKAADYLHYLLTFQKHIRRHIAQNGLPHIVHVHIAMKAGLAALWIKRKWHIPYLLTEHWTIYNSTAPDRFEHKSFLFRYFNRLVVKNAAMLLPVSNNLGDAIKQKLYPTTSQRVLNAVDTSLFYYQPSTNKDSFLLLHVSVMNAQKNPEGIIRAFAALHKTNSHTRLMMIGPNAPGVAAMPEKLGLPPGSITFTGEIAYAEVAACMQQADALVMFSYYENMPCVILEALCCGLPVISTWVGGVAEVVNTQNGYLVTAGNEQELHGAMLEMITHYNRFNRKEISDAAQKDFSYQTTGAAMSGIYLSVTGRGNTE
ncbi:glycosyltransferase [Foetidibacter luteolus]|uniref:glycosyltransferase n=1 Tax=Foetidibacter luteolus TaxID=2608880 RepID=UPI00129A864D|nr:glycosyltransferase [Foetidibacter luteolus]